MKNENETLFRRTSAESIASIPTGLMDSTFVEVMNQHTQDVLSGDFPKENKELIEECRRWMDAGAHLGALPKDTLGHILHAAVALEDQGMVDQLIHVGADMNHQENGETALFELYKSNNPGKTGLNLAIFDKMLAAGANINGLGESGFSLLHCFCSNAQSEDQHVHDVAHLLARGADMRILDPLGRTPLHLAAGQNKHRICTLLIEHGADPDALFRGEQTALFIAAGAGHAVTCMELLKCGANPDLKFQNKSIWGHAGSKNHKETAQILKNFCGSLKATQAIDAAMAKMGISP